MKTEEGHLRTNTWKRAQLIHSLGYVRVKLIAQLLGGLLDIPNILRKMDRVKRRR